MNERKELNTQTNYQKYTQYEVEIKMKEKKENKTKENTLLRPKAGALSVLSLEKESLRLSLLALIPVQATPKDVACYNPNVWVGEQCRIYLDVFFCCDYKDKFEPDFV